MDDRVMLRRCAGRSGRSRRVLEAFVTVLVAVLTVGVPHAPAGASATPDPAPPAMTTPATTTPETAPSTEAPPDSTVPGTGAATEPDATEPDDWTSVSTVGVVIGLVGIVVLIAIAAWWMVRRDDEDDAPHPPGPSSYGDLI